MTDVKHDIDALAGERWFPLETTITEDMSSIWGDWGVCSEVDKLKAVLMRRPGKEVENFDWKAARFRAPIDPEKFRAQHDALADVYRAHGVQVHYVDEQRGDRPNALFCRDLVFMTPEGAIVTRPATEARRGEERYAAKKLADLGVPINRTADGLHQAIGGSNIPVQVAEKSFHSTLFHLVCGGTEMHGRYLLDALPLKGAQVNTFRSASSFQIAVGDGFPAMPPDLGVLLVVPVHGVLLVAFPVPGREPDTLAVLVKVINLPALGKPFPGFVHCPDGQQDVGMGIPVPLVVNGKIGNHAFGNKKLPAIVPDQAGVL